MLQGIPSPQRLCHTLPGRADLSKWPSQEAPLDQTVAPKASEAQQACHHEVEAGSLKSQHPLVLGVHGLDSSKWGGICKGSAGKNRVIESHIWNDAPPYTKDHCYNIKLKFKKSKKS